VAVDVPALAETVGANTALTDLVLPDVSVAVAVTTRHGFDGIAAITEAGSEQAAVEGHGELRTVTVADVTPAGMNALGTFTTLVFDPLCTSTVALVLEEFS
jgi:hypothetical protein